MSDFAYSHTLQIADGSSIEDLFLRKARILTPYFEMQGFPAADVLSCATDSAAIDAYCLSLEVVRYLVEAEVDTSTDSRSRLGLPARTVEPRLGGYFHDELADGATAVVIAACVESCIANGFAALAVDPGRRPSEWTGEFRSFDRRLEITTELVEEFPDGVLEHVSIAGQEDRDELLRCASEFGLFGGMLSFRKKAVVNMDSYALMRVGSMLWEASI